MEVIPIFVHQNFRFSDFGPKSNINSLRKWGEISEIPVLDKFQTAVKIALVDEFKWNLWQMEALGWNFSIFFEFWNFDYFCMFYSYFNIGQIRIFENDGKCRICSILEKFCGKYEYFLSKFENLTFFSSPRATKPMQAIFYIYSRSRDKIRNVKSVFRFSGFCLISLRNSFREWGKISENQIFDKLQ